MLLILLMPLQGQKTPNLGFSTPEVGGRVGYIKPNNSKKVRTIHKNTKKH